MSALVVVHTDGRADYLVECLPDVGLAGTAIDADTVHILDLAGSDPNDVAWEIDQYGDRFSVTRIEVIPEPIRSTSTGSEL